jgi:hypothetical protein
MSLYRQLHALDLESDLSFNVSLPSSSSSDKPITDLILQIIPPVRPRLLHTSLLIQHRARNERREDRMGHRHPVVVVAVHNHARFELGVRATIDFQSVVKLFGLDAEFGCERLSVSESNQCQRRSHQARRS